ncbi:membrane protein [Morganella morganii]|nr:membrane protein [Morganella morganii]
MKDKIEFSFLTGMFGFGSPLIIYFAYFGFILSRNIKPTKKTTTTAKYLAGIAIAGMVFSLFFSGYINVNLTSKGYLTCDKKSIFSPNEYVISKNMCR